MFKLLYVFIVYIEKIFECHKCYNFLCKCLTLKIYSNLDILKHCLNWTRNETETKFNKKCNGKGVGDLKKGEGNEIGKILSSE